MKVKLHSQILNFSIGCNLRRQTSTTQGYNSWPHGMTNVSFPELNILKNSSTLAVSVPINVSIKLDFDSVNGPRETYFVDALCTVYHSEVKKKILEKMCVFVSVCLNVMSHNVGPKPIKLSHSNSTSRAHFQISPVFFLNNFPPILKINDSSYKEKF